MPTPTLDTQRSILAAFVAGRLPPALTDTQETDR